MRGSWLIPLAILCGLVATAVAGGDDFFSSSPGPLSQSHATCGSSHELWNIVTVGFSQPSN